MIEQLTQTRVRRLPCVRVTLSEHERIAGEAVRLGKSVSELTREALTFYTALTQAEVRLVQDER